MSLTPEAWRLAQRGSDALGTFVWVDRVQDGRVTSWKLRPRTGYPGQWRIFQVYYSRENEGLNREAERLKEYYYREGIKLTDNRIDRMLHSFATTGEGI